MSKRTVTANIVPSRYRFVLLILALLAGRAVFAEQEAPWVGLTLQGASCTGSNAGNFGPFDYVTRKDKLPVVENRHFTQQVEQLKRGESTTEAMGDINYTLTKFPNHHRALYSAIRYSLGEVPKSQRGNYYAECYLQRAIHYSPSDPVPHMLFGIYLHRAGKLEQSLKHYRTAEQMAPNDPNLLYNFGLALFDAGHYGESYQYARKAYDYGMEFPALKRKLRQAGYWK